MKKFRIVGGYQDNFGLMSEEKKQRLKQRLMVECKEWMRATTNNWLYFNGE